MKQTVMKYKSHIAALAVIALVLVVPMGAAAFADTLNETIGGGHKSIHAADELTDMKKVQMVVGTNHPDSIGYMTYQHKNDAGNVRYDAQTPFMVKDTVYDYNQVVITSASPTHYATPDTKLIMKFEFDVQDWVKTGADRVRFGLASSSPGKVMFENYDSVSDIANGGAANGALSFVGTDGTTTKIVRVPVTFEVNETVGTMSGSSMIMNVTSDIAYFDMIVDQAAIISASTILKDMPYQAMAIRMQNVGADIIDVGDVLSFSMEVLGPHVNGFSVANLFMGLTGCCLIVGAVFATQLANLSDLRKGGRVRNKVSNYRADRYSRRQDRKYKSNQWHRNWRRR